VPTAPELTGEAGAVRPRCRSRPHPRGSGHHHDDHQQRDGLRPHLVRRWVERGKRPAHDELDAGSQESESTASA
jgi:hypothetical protein